MSKPINDGGSAFPLQIEHIQSIANERGETVANAARSLGYDPGMTLRDWFAGMAIGSCLSAQCPPGLAQGSKEHREQSVAAAYLIADSMLAARQEKEGA